jgi:acyl-CoA thioesterase I
MVRRFIGPQFIGRRFIGRRLIGRRLLVLGGPAAAGVSAPLTAGVSAAWAAGVSATLAAGTSTTVAASESDAAAASASATSAAGVFAVSGLPIRLLVLGDSLTAGYGLPHDDGFQAQLAAALKPSGFDVTIVDGSVSGDTSAGGLARLDWVLSGGADAAIVELGGNDGLRGLDPKAMDQNLTAILDRLAAAYVKVLLSGMYPPGNFGPDYSREFHAVFDRLGQRPGVLYDPFFLEGVATDPVLNQPDGLHPNAQGVARIVARLLPMVTRLLGEVRAT